MCFVAKGDGTWVLHESFHFFIFAPRPSLLHTRLKIYMFLEHVIAWLVIASKKKIKILFSLTTPIAIDHTHMISKGQVI
jgi:hypothetical protein